MYILICEVKCKAPENYKPRTVTYNCVALIKSKAGYKSIMKDFLDEYSIKVREANPRVNLQFSVSKTLIKEVHQMKNFV